MPRSEGSAATAARNEIRSLAAEKGHAVDVARAVLSRVDRAFAEGALTTTPALTQALADLRLAIEPAERVAGTKLGGKSAEAARMILRVVIREIDRA